MSTILNSLPIPTQFSDADFPTMQPIELDVTKERLLETVELWAQSARAIGLEVWVSQSSDGLCAVSVTVNDENGEYLRGALICVGVRGQFPRFA